MYFLYSLGGVTFNKCWITLSILNCYSPNFQGFILMKNALNNQVGMLGDMFLWLIANLKQGVIYFIKQALPPNKSAGSVSSCFCGLVFSISWGELWFFGLWRPSSGDIFCNPYEPANILAQGRPEVFGCDSFVCPQFSRMPRECGTVMVV